METKPFRVWRTSFYYTEGYLHSYLFIYLGLFLLEMDKKIQSVNIYEKKKLDNPDIEYDKTGKTRPAWIKLRNQVESKFLTISFGYGNINYMEFLHSGFFLPVNYTKEEMKKLYDQFAENYDEVVKGFGDELGVIKKVIDLFCKLGKDKSSKILDIGSGTGRGTEVLFEKGYENITLLELSKEMLDSIMNKWIKQNMSFYKLMNEAPISVKKSLLNL